MILTTSAKVKFQTLQIVFCFSLQLLVSLKLLPKFLFNPFNSHKFLLT